MVTSKWMFAALGQRSSPFAGSCRPPMLFGAASPPSVPTSLRRDLRETAVTPGVRRGCGRSSSSEPSTSNPIRCGIVPAYQRAGSRAGCLCRSRRGHRTIASSRWPASPASGIVHRSRGIKRTRPIGPQSGGRAFGERSRTRSTPESSQYVADYYADAGEIDVSRSILQPPNGDIDLSSLSRDHGAFDVSLRYASATKRWRSRASICRYRTSWNRCDGRRFTIHAHADGRDIQLT
jgi:hypothetical protein